MYIQEINEEYTQLIKDVETTSLIVADLKKIKSNHKSSKIRFKIMDILNE